jgi:anti-sigma regulatory factor (Ser/Thr protein kinase)
MKTIELPASIEQLAYINDHLRECMTGKLAPLLMKTQLVVEELLANISSYAYDGSAGVVEFSCGSVTFDGKNFLRISFLDHGKPFDPFSVNLDPHASDSIDDRPIGGLGIHFVKTLSTHYMYSRFSDTNAVDILIDASDCNKSNEK